MKLIKLLTTQKKKWGIVRYALFLCEYCGKEVERERGTKQKSCGCATKKLIGEFSFKHGDAGNKKLGIKMKRLYRIWHDMKTRTEKETFKQYKDYGGRGIKVCKEWSSSYINFREWSLTNGYQDNLQIDRINNDGNYEPYNCRWVTNLVNMRNRNCVKLNMDKARLIRGLYFATASTRKMLADNFGLKIKTIDTIIYNRAWKETNE